MRPGNQATLLGGFTDEEGKQLPKSKRTIIMTYSESSCLERLNKVRGYSALNQTELLHIISLKALELTLHDRLHFSGSNRGNVLCNIDWPKYERMWALSKPLKKKVLGKAICLVGGKCEDSDVPKPTIGTSATEVVFWHAMPTAIADELIHSYDLVSAIILSAGDGSLIVPFLQQRKPVFVVTLTDNHTELLKLHLEKVVWESFQNSESPLYQPNLVSLLASQEAEVEDDEEDDEKADHKGSIEDQQVGKQAKKRGRKGSAKVKGKPSKQPKTKSKDGVDGMTKEQLLTQLEQMGEREAGIEAEREDSHSE